MAEGDLVVLHGYTKGGLDALAALVVRRWGHRWPGTDPHEMHEMAWGAIAEALCASNRRPWPSELEDAGRDALHEEMRAQGRHHGISRRAGGATGRNFERYWLWHAHSARSPEAEITDRVAVQQILPAITAMPRKALVVLAGADNDYEMTCQLLAVPPAVLHLRLRDGRQQFAELWYGDEWHGDQ
jgi:uncharacterized protein (DUF2236 family)